MENQGFENVPKNKAPIENAENQENGVESQIEEEMTKLNSGLEAVQNDINGLSDEEKFDLLNSKAFDKSEKFSSATWTAITGALAAGSALIEAEILPQINWNLHDDKLTAEALGVATVGAAVMAIYKFSEFLKYKKRVKQAEQIS